MLVEVRANNVGKIEIQLKIKKIKPIHLCLFRKVDF